MFLPGESQGRGAWWAAVYGVAQSWFIVLTMNDEAVQHSKLSALL